MNIKEEKQYGLIAPKKKQLAAPKPINVFGDDNSSEEEEGTDWVKRALKAEGEKNKVKKQTKLDMQKALNQDPTIYQYDEVYDDIEQNRIQTKPVQTEKKKPKYIQNLLKAAERRKKEQEHRIERAVQKEREAEGDMYADKESFVTSAYRAKLEEFKKMEEEEARMDRIEAITDVTKQQDISGFYRHLYAQTVDNRGQTDNTKEDSVLENKTDERTENSAAVEEKVPTNKTNEPQISVKKPKKPKQYRQRVVESDESEPEPETVKESNVEEANVSHSKNDNPTDTEIKEPEKKKQKIIKESDVRNENSKGKENSPSNTQKPKTKESSPDDESKKSENDTDEKEEKDENDENDTEKKKPVVKKDKSSIWQKRTVGPVFEAALQRYYARKAMRTAAT